MVLQRKENVKDFLKLYISHTYKNSRITFFVCIRNIVGQFERTYVAPKNNSCLDSAENCHVTQGCQMAWIFLEKLEIYLWNSFIEYSLHVIHFKCVHIIW